MILSFVPLASRFQLFPLDVSKGFAQRFHMATALRGRALIRSGGEAQSVAMRLLSHLLREHSALLHDPERYA